jgi:hypothetical protein
LIADFWQGFFEFAEVLWDILRGVGSMPPTEHALSAALLAIYILPGYVAHKRRAVRRSGVYVVTALLGWTGVFWVLALAWAVAADQEPEPWDHPRQTPRL